MTDRTQDKQAEVDFFDAYQGEYDALSESGYGRILAEFREAAGAKPGLSVLDAGSGSGEFTARLQGLGYHATGVDISSGLVETARRKYPEIPFETADIEQLPYPDNHFDVVTLFGVLHHFSDFSRVLAEAYRVLKWNGILFTFDPNINNPFFLLYHSKNSPLYSGKTITSNEILFSRNYLEEKLSETRLTTKRVYCIGGVPLNLRSRKYSNSKKPFILLFNMFESLIDLTSLRTIWGSAIISVSTKWRDCSNEQ